MSLLTFNLVGNRDIWGFCLFSFCVCQASRGFSSPCFSSPCHNAEIIHSHTMHPASTRDLGTQTQVCPTLKYKNCFYLLNWPPPTQPAAITSLFLAETSALKIFRKRGGLGKGHGEPYILEKLVRMRDEQPPDPLKKVQAWKKKKGGHAQLSKIVIVKAKCVALILYCYKTIL